MKENIILLSKDVLRADYLSVYGNKYWKTPNISELADKGTVFRSHYTAAPSTAMSFTSMLTGLYPHEIKDRGEFVKVDKFKQGKTLFNYLEELEYKCHIIWPDNYTGDVEYVNCFSNIPTFHFLKLNQSVGPHKAFDRNDIKQNDMIAKNCITRIMDEVKKIKDERVFIWVHLPHVLKGRSCYGSDIDLFDDMVGEFRKLFSDDNIYITGDHGHMNMEKGISAYAFHVYEGAIRIPLITPRINNKKNVEFPTSNTQLIDIMINNNIVKKNVIYSDSAYYRQLSRKITLIKGNYKYIYTKKTGGEELYDLKWDPQENVNLLVDSIFDKERNRKVMINQLFFYPHQEFAATIHKELQSKKNEIWRNGNFIIEQYKYYRRKAAFLKTNILFQIKGRILQQSK